MRMYVRFGWGENEEGNEGMVYKWHTNGMLCMLEWYIYGMHAEHEREREGEEKRGREGLSSLPSPAPSTRHPPHSWAGQKPHCLEKEHVHAGSSLHFTSHFKGGVFISIWRREGKTMDGGCIFQWKYFQGKRPASSRLARLLACRMCGYRYIMIFIAMPC